MYLLYGIFEKLCNVFAADSSVLLKLMSGLNGGLYWHYIPIQASVFQIHPPQAPPSPVSRHFQAYMLVVCSLSKITSFSIKNPECAGVTGTFAIICSASKSPVLLLALSGANSSCEGLISRGELPRQWTFVLSLLVTVKIQRSSPPNIWQVYRFNFLSNRY